MLSESKELRDFELKMPRDDSAKAPVPEDGLQKFEVAKKYISGAWIYYRAKLQEAADKHNPLMVKRALEEMRQAIAFIDGRYSFALCKDDAGHYYALLPRDKSLLSRIEGVGDVLDSYASFYAALLNQVIQSGTPELISYVIAAAPRDFDFGKETIVPLSTQKSKLKYYYQHRPLYHAMDRAMNASGSQEGFEGALGIIVELLQKGVPLDSAGANVPGPLEFALEGATHAILVLETKQLEDKELAVAKAKVEKALVLAKKLIDLGAPAEAKYKSKLDSQWLPQRTKQRNLAQALVDLHDVYINVTLPGLEVLRAARAYTRKKRDNTSELNDLLNVYGAVGKDLFEAVVRKRSSLIAGGATEPFITRINHKYEEALIRNIRSANVKELTGKEGEYEDIVLNFKNIPPAIADTIKAEGRGYAAAKQYYEAVMGALQAAITSNDVPSIDMLMRTHGKAMAKLDLRYNIYINHNNDSLLLPKHVCASNYKQYFKGKQVGVPSYYYTSFYNCLLSVALSYDALEAVEELVRHIPEKYDFNEPGTDFVQDLVIGQAVYEQGSKEPVAFVGKQINISARQTENLPLRDLIKSYNQQARGYRAEKLRNVINAITTKASGRKRSLQANINSVDYNPVFDCLFAIREIYVRCHDNAVMPEDRLCLETNRMDNRVLHDQLELYNQLMELGAAVTATVPGTKITVADYYNQLQDYFALTVFPVAEIGQALRLISATQAANDLVTAAQARTQAYTMLSGLLRSFEVDDLLEMASKNEAITGMFPQGTDVRLQLQNIFESAAERSTHVGALRRAAAAAASAGK